MIRMPHPSPLRPDRNARRPLRRAHSFAAFLFGFGASCASMSAGERWQCHGPGRMRVSFILIAALFAVTTAQAQVGYDRRGGDYFSFKVGNGDPAACAARCEREARCRAWTFSYPRTVAPSAICALKSQVTPRVEDPRFVSGVRGAGSRIAVADYEAEVI